MLLAQISGDLIGDVFIVFLEPSEAGDGSVARIDRLARGGPLKKERHGFIVSKRTKRAERSVA